MMTERRLLFVCSLLLLSSLVHGGGTLTLSAANPKVVVDYTLTGDNITCTVTVDQTAWIALGVGTAMIGTDAVIGLPAANSVTRVVLSAKILTGQIAVTDSVSQTSITQTGGSTVMTFSRNLAVSAASVGTPIDPASVTFVWAVGSSNTYAQHSTTFRAVAQTMNLGGAVYTVDTTAKLAHGSFMLTGWGILLPAGMLVARYFKGLRGDGRSWLTLHKGLQAAGVLAVTIGFFIATTDIATNFASGHSKFGLALFLLLWLQPIIVLFRPKESSDKHPTWNMAHSWYGRIILLLGMVNVFIGISWLRMGGNNQKAFYGVYVFVWLLTLITIAAFEIKRCRNGEGCFNRNTSTK